MTQTKIKSESEKENNLEDYLNECPDEVEMSFFDHLEELRRRIFYVLIAVAMGIIACFIFVKPIVNFLEIPAQGIKFQQLAPQEFLFVSFQVAGYGGLLLATPFILYQIAQFVLPGLTRKERRFLGPIVFGSSILFVGGLAFAYYVLIPAALKFFLLYGADVVEPNFSIDRYFKFILLLLFSTGLLFQLPVIQLSLGLLDIVPVKKMLSAWRYVIVITLVVAAIFTPSTDPLTQSLLAGPILALYFGSIGLLTLLKGSKN